MTPALTAAEWEAKRISYGNGPAIEDQGCGGHGYHLDDDGELIYEIGYEGCDRDEAVDRPHAIAALALYGQPFGFTHDDISDALLAATVLEQAGLPANATSLRHLADRIAALLPPAP